MNRRQFIKHLTNHNCYLLRHGASHDIYQNNSNQNISSVPRHNALNRNTCQIICKQLEIPSPV